MSVAVVGAISSFYFIGIALGSYFTPTLINRVGHIRAYATFAAMISVATLIQGMWGNIWIWGGMRLIYGYGLAGLFILIESWVATAGGDDSKGWALALYLLIYYLAQSFSQLFLKLHFSTSLQAFCLIAILSTFSIVPLSQTRTQAPSIDQPELLSPRKVFRQAPLGIWLSFISGMILAVIYTIQPYFLSLVGLDHNKIAYAMGVTILGGALLQVPIGKWSDMVDRRKVILFMCLSSLVLATAIIFFHHYFSILLLLLFLLGGSTFTLYPLAMSHTTDYMKKGAIISAIGVLTLAYGVGSVLGPLIATFMMKFIGPYGLFMTIAMLSAALLLYAIWRVYKREPMDPKKQRHFINSLPGTSVNPEELAVQLDIPVDELNQNENPSSAKGVDPS